MRLTTLENRLSFYLWVTHSYDYLSKFRSNYIGKVGGDTENSLRYFDQLPSVTLNLKWRLLILKSESGTRIQVNKIENVSNVRYNLIYQIIKQFHYVGNNLFFRKILKYYK